MAPRRHAPAAARRPAPIAPARLTDDALIRAAAAAEVEWTGTFGKGELARARELRAEVERRGLGPEVVRALASPHALGARPGPTVRLVCTPYGAMPSLVAVDLRDLAPESAPEVDPRDILSIEAAR